MNAFHKCVRIAVAAVGLAGLGFALQINSGARSFDRVAIAQTGGPSDVAFDALLNPSCGAGAPSYQIDISSASQLLQCPATAGFRWAVVLTKCPSCTNVAGVTVTASNSATGQSETLPADANGVVQRNGCAMWLPNTITIHTNGCPVRSARIVLGCCTLQPAPPPPLPPGPPTKCEPVYCELICQCGFATGPDGCEFCSCRPCDPN